MAYCGLCDRYFGSDRALWQHIDNSYVHECQFCSYHFYDDDDERQHLSDDHERCNICSDWVADCQDLHTHYISYHSQRYCESCRRVFIAPSNLQSHLNSSLHRPKNVSCPHRSLGCRQTFVSHSAMTLHLESGHCVSGMTRADVNQRIIELDRNRIITDPSRLLTSGSGSYSATNRAWNGHAWECYLCHAEKASREALNQHLNSPRHEQKIYFCPQPRCGQRFSALSGLMQHIESDRCGVQRFRVVQDAIAQLTNGMRRLGM